MFAQFHVAVVPDEGEDTYGWLGKACGNISRIALALHLLTGDTGDIFGDIVPPGLGNCPTAGGMKGYAVPGGLTGDKGDLSPGRMDGVTGIISLPTE